MRGYKIAASDAFNDTNYPKVSTNDKQRVTRLQLQLSQAGFYSTHTRAGISQS
ncbi:MAG: hypothetical protein GXC78_09625 [Chitinophagaceae bacterium]|nr:hypothetical protein [Chitinophagaceae bacterium]